MKKELQEIVVLIVMTLATIFGIYMVAIAINNAINDGERRECYKWVEHEKEYENFFWADWQKAQCRHHGIIK